MNALLLLTAFVCAFAGFVALSLGMERHFHDVLGPQRPFAR